MELGRGVTSGSVISWNDYNTSDAFVGSETWVVSYTQMLAGLGSVSVRSFPVDTTKFSVVPAHELSGTPTEWATYNASYSRSHAGIEHIDGDPIAGTVTLGWNEYSWAPTSQPNDARQLGTSILVDTQDDRAISAVYRGGVVWMATNDMCIVGTQPARVCARLTKFDVTVPSPLLVQALLVAGSGSFLYYPAITMDGNGDTFFVYSRSSNNAYVFVQVTDVLAGTPNGQTSGTTTVKTGQAPYTDIYQRWGDYSSAGPDPAADANRVWVGGEYAASGTGSNWGTVVGQIAP